MRILALVSSLAIVLLVLGYASFMGFGVSVSSDFSLRVLWVVRDNLSPMFDMAVSACSLGSRLYIGGFENGTMSFPGRVRVEVRSSVDGSLISSTTLEVNGLLYDCIPLGQRVLFFGFNGSEAHVNPLIVIVDPELAELKVKVFNWSGAFTAVELGDSSLYALSMLLDDGRPVGIRVDELTLDLEIRRTFMLKREIEASDMFLDRDSKLLWIIGNALRLTPTIIAVNTTTMSLHKLLELSDTLNAAFSILASKGHIYVSGFKLEYYQLKGVIVKLNEEGDVEARLDLEGSWPMDMDFMDGGYIVSVGFADPGRVAVYLLDRDLNLLLDRIVDNETSTAFRLLVNGSKVYIPGFSGVEDTLWTLYALELVAPTDAKTITITRTVTETVTTTSTATVTIPVIRTTTTTATTIQTTTSTITTTTILTTVIERTLTETRIVTETTTRDITRLVTERIATTETLTKTATIKETITEKTVETRETTKTVERGVTTTVATLIALATLIAGITIGFLVKRR